MEKQPTVDVVIPNCNYGHYLLSCADSVLSQQNVSLRLLIIDNASNDNSQSLARQIASCDSRVELLLRSENAGPHASFNAGIDWAQSDYFLILCADDVLAQGALSRAVNLLDCLPDVHLAHGTAQKILNNESCFAGRINSDCEKWTVSTGDEFIRRACKYAFNPVAGPTAVVRTSVQKQAGYYRKTLPHTDDLEMWLRLALHGGVASTRSLQAFARVHAHNQSASVAGIRHWNREFEAGFRSFFENEGAQLPQADVYFDAVRQCLTKRAYWSAISQLLRGDAEALSLMSFVLKRHPLMALLPPVDYLLQRRRRALG